MISHRYTIRAVFYRGPILDNDDEAGEPDGVERSNITISDDEADTMKTKTMILMSSRKI